MEQEPFLIAIDQTVCELHWLICLAKSWQSAVGALLGVFGGLVAIVAGALINACLVRRRDDRIRKTESQALKELLLHEIDMLGSEALYKAGMIKGVPVNSFSQMDFEFNDLHVARDPFIFNSVVSELTLMDQLTLEHLLLFYSEYKIISSLSTMLYVEKTKDSMLGVFYNNHCQIAKLSRDTLNFFGKDFAPSVLKSFEELEIN